MSKLRKSILIIGIIVIAVAASLGTALALMASGSIKTDPIELVYAVKDEQKVYDGTPLKAKEYRLESGELVVGHRAQVEFLGEQTSVGESASDLSVKIYDADGYNVTNSYNIKVVQGALSVSKKSISVVMPSQKVVYNGSKVLFSEYQITEESEGDLVAGHKIYGSTEAGLMNVGDTLPKELTPLVFDVVGNDVTENYEIDFTTGDIEVIPRDISVCPVSYEKVFDGSALVAEDIKFLSGSLVEGQRAEWEINSGEDSITDAGSVDTFVTSLKIFDIIDGNEVEVTSNYNIEDYESGTLTVLKRPLKIVGKGQTFVYNGEDRYVDDNQPLSVEGIAEGDEFISVVYEGTIRNVSERVVNEIVGINIMGNLDNYEVEIVNGDLAVTPFETTVVTGTKEKYYDGTALKDGALAVVAANADHVYRVAGGETVPEITSAGTIENIFHIELFDGEENVTDNYKISYTFGTLTVDRLPVTANLSHYAEVYDGKDKTLDLTKSLTITSIDEELTEVANGLLKPADFAVDSSYRAIRDAGDYYYKVKFVADPTRKAEFANYDLDASEPGFYTVNKKVAQVATGDVTRVYDGEPIYDNIPVCEDGTLAEGHVFDAVKNYPERVDVGETKNEYKLTVLDADKRDVTANYDIKMNCGTLKVDVLDVLVELQGSRTFTYANKPVTLKPQEAIKSVKTTDGNATAAVSCDDFKVMYGVSGEDGGYVFDDESTLTDVGEYRYMVELANAKLTGNVNFTNDQTYSNITVEKRNIEITLKNVNRVYDSKVYDLEPYTLITNISDTSTGLTKDDFALSYVETDQKALAKAGMHNYTAVIKAEKSGNYNLTVQNATTPYVTVAKMPMTVTFVSKSFVYNGKAQSCPEFSTSGFAASSHYISLSGDAPKITNCAEEVQNAYARENITVLDSSDSNANVTENYNISVKAGKLEVTKRPVTVTTVSKSKIYDGKELKEDKVTASNLAEGEAPSRLSTSEAPKITDVGWIKNEFDCGIFRSGVDVTNNYVITYLYGSLEVTRCPVTITTYGATRVYNGKALKGAGNVGVDDAPVAGGVVSGDSVSIKAGTAIPEITDVGSVENKLVCEITNGGKDVTGNYDVKYVYGTLKVTPASASITVKTVEKDYNGKEIAVTLADVILGISTEGGLLANGDLVLEVGKIVDAGYYDYTVKISDEKAKNFSFTSKRGQIYVKPMPVTITYANLNKTFNNQVQTANVEEDILVACDDGLLINSDFTLSYSATPLEAGTYSYVALLSNANKKASNFDIDDTRFGQITISKATVNATCKPFTFTYDGTVKTISIADALTVDNSCVSLFDFELAVTGAPLKNAKTYNYTVNYQNAEFASKNLNLNVTPSTVTINPLDVNVTAKSFEFTYDGATHTLLPEDALTIGSPLLKAEMFTITPSGAIKNAGEYTYIAAFNGGAEAGNFNVADVQGKARVNKAEATVTLSVKSKVYDGLSYTLTTADISSISTSLLAKTDFNVNYSDGAASHNNVGTYPFTATISAAKANNFNVTVVGGTFTVTKRSATVYFANATKVYDGQAFTDAELSALTYSGFVNGEIPVKSATATLSDFKKVGTAANSFVCALNKNDINNYEIKYVAGTLTITKRPVTITTKDVKGTYDGATAFSDDNVTMSGGVAGDNVKALGTVPSLKDAGKIQNAIYCDIVDASGASVIGNYDVTYGFGYITVETADVTIRLNPLERTYNGAPQVITVGEAAPIPAGAPITAADLTIDSKGSAMREAGSYRYSVTLSSALLNNVNLTVTEGLLKINKAALTVTLGRIAVTYDGNAHYGKISPANIGANYDSLTVNDFRVVNLEEAKNVKEGGYEYTCEFIGPAAGNYTLTVTNGVIVVDKATVSVTLKNYSAVYDGNVHVIDVNDAITSITSDAPISPSDFIVTCTDGEIKKAKSYTYAVVIANKLMENNLNLTVTNGTYEVAKRKIVLIYADLIVSADDYSNNGSGGIYDATSIVSVSAATPLASGDSITISATATGDYTGNANVVATVTVSNADCYYIDLINDEATVKLIPMSSGGSGDVWG